MKSFPQSLFFFFCKFGYLKRTHEDAANACNGHLRTTNASIDIRARQTHLHINGKKKKKESFTKSRTLQPGGNHMLPISTQSNRLKPKVELTPPSETTP